MGKKSSPITHALIRLMVTATHAADIYVAQSGSDANQGTSDQPLASLAGAQKMVRKAGGREAVTVHVADGVYYLPETLIFTAQDSGAEEPMLRSDWAIYRGGSLVLTGIFRKPKLIKIRTCPFWMR